MNNILRTLLAATGFAAFLAGTTIGAPAKPEQPMPAASIQPKGEVKPTDLPALAKITFQQAVSAALAAAPGSVIKAELEVEDGNLVYSFEIVGADKSITEVEIDAGNGKVLATDKESAAKEEPKAEVKKEKKAEKKKDKKEKDEDDEKDEKKEKKD